MKFEVKYIGRSSIQFTRNQLYQVELIYGSYRKGSKSDPLVIYKLSNGYRITPFEFKHFWKYKDTMTGMRAIMEEVYNSPASTFSMADLVYSSNPFLALVPKTPGISGGSFTVPIK